MHTMTKSEICSIVIRCDRTIVVILAHLSAPYCEVASRDLILYQWVLGLDNYSSVYSSAVIPVIAVPFPMCGLTSVGITLRQCFWEINFIERELIAYRTNLCFSAGIALKFGKEFSSIISFVDFVNTFFLVNNNGLCLISEQSFRTNHFELI